jgi:hypothetical protein
VLEPASITGDFEHTRTKARDGWATHDMALVGNLAVDTLLPAFHGSAAAYLLSVRNMAQGVNKVNVLTTNKVMGTRVVL